MKKFLLTLIVTMLTCLGAWAQVEGTPLSMEIGQSLDIYGYHFNSTGTYGSAGIVWEKSDPANPTVNIIGIQSSDAALTTELVETGHVKITVNSACSNVPVQVNFERITYVYNESNNWAGAPEVYDHGVFTFLVTAKGNTCTWSYNGSEWTSGLPVQITLDKADAEKKDKYFEFTTLWEEKDDQSQIESVVSHNTAAASVNWSGGKGFYINSVAKGEADITVTAKNGNQTDTRTIHVIVNDRSLATSLSLGVPSENPFYQGTSITVPVTFAPETATFPEPTVSPANQGVTAVLSGNILTISATESAPTGDYTITVSPQDGSDASAQSVNVTVKDKTHASSINAPETVSVAYGNGTANYAKDFTISFEPATAQIAIDNENSTIPSDVTCSLSADYKTLTVNANNATAASTGKIVLKSGDLTKDIYLNVVAPKHVTGVTLKEGETVLGDTKTIDKDDKFTITAEVAPEDAADATLTWTNSDPSVASFNQTTGEVIGLKAGETTITATSRSIAGHDAETASVRVIVEETLTANVDNFPAAAISLGANFTPSVTVTNAGIAADDYEVSYTIDPSDVLTRNAENGQFTAAKAGTATVTINVTATEAGIAAHYKNAAPIQKVVEVKKNEYALAISADKKLFKTGESGSAGISVTSVTLNGNDATSDAEKAKYSISYEVNPTYAGVRVGEESGAVTVDPSAAKGQATIVATLTPSDVDNNTVATASVTLTIADVITGGATIKKEGDFYVINVPYPGALAESLSKANESGIDDEVSAKAALLSAEKLKFTGDINNDDMVAFTNIVGTTGAYLHQKVNEEDEQIDNLNVLKTLDMSGATLVENATATSGSHSFTSDYWKYRLYSVTDFTVPTPASDAIVLPTYFGQWCPNMVSLTIPNGWKSIGESAFNGNTALRTLDMSGCETLTEIKESAFENCRTAPGQGLSDIKFAPNLAIIRENAFKYHEATVLMFPPKIREIYAGAFENYGGANSLTDVFFTGVEVTPNYVATTAFSASTQMCNNSLADNAKLPNGDPAISNGTITRNSYHNGGFLGCILHFPAEADRWRYTDPKREYSDGGRSEYTGGSEEIWNKKSMFGYNPDGWDAEFASTMTTLATQIHGEEQQAGFLYGSSTTRWDVALTDGVYIDGGYPDRTYGENKIWPSQQQMQNGYTISRAGYLWNGTQMTEDQLNPATNTDLRGLYQFIVAFTDAPDDPENWNLGDKYEMGLWYTLCVPFNMSVDEIQNVFGKNTQVCRFSKVTRNIYDDSRANELVLEFRKSVMVEGGYATTDYIKIKTEKGSDGKPVYTYADGTTTGIVHHVPYMIKPGGSVSIENPDAEGYIKPEFKNNGDRILPNFKRVGDALYHDQIKADDAHIYSFEGIFEPIPLIDNIYFLAADKDDSDIHKFYYSNGATGTLNAYTASVYVRKPGAAEDRGADDYVPFFTDKVINGSAPIFKSVFADDEKTTEIEKVVIVCGQDKVNDNKVYTIGGQLVNSNNLPAGLYIKNGKKFIVK